MPICPVGRACEKAHQPRRNGVVPGGVEGRRGSRSSVPDADPEGRSRSCSGQASRTRHMVQSKAPTVDAYLAEAAPERRPYLQLVREVARRVLADHEERMHWGMPVYMREQKIGFAFADQKQFVSLYFMDPRVLDENAEAIAGLIR